MKMRDGMDMKKPLTLTMIALCASLPATLWGYCENEAGKLKSAEEAIFQCERTHYDARQCSSEREHADKVRTEVFECEQIHSPKAPSRMDLCKNQSAIFGIAIESRIPRFFHCRDELKKDYRNCLEFACGPVVEAKSNLVECKKKNGIPNPPSVSPCRVFDQYRY